MLTAFLHSDIMIYSTSVPATSANLGPGYDAIGLALQLYNRFSFEERNDGASLSVAVSGTGSEGIPTDESNLVFQAAMRVFEAVDFRPNGLHITIENSLPSTSGLGSSSTAIVGGLLCANALAGSPLDRDELLRMAAVMEGHPDNVMPAICGGLTIGVLDGEELIAEKIDLPPMEVVIVTPSFAMPTAESRSVVPGTLSIQDAVFNIGRSALLLRVLATGHFEKLRVAMQDRLHQPYRLKLIPGFEEAMAVAYENGADGVALSGAGPSMIAIARENHQVIADRISAEFKRHGTDSQQWILPIDNVGASVTTHVPA